MMRTEIIGDCTLYLGDAREILPTIGLVDVLVTDPPYGIQYASGHATPDLWGEDRHIENDHDTTARDVVLAMVSAPCLVFGSRKAPLPAGCRQVLIWDKGGALGAGALDLPWKPAHEEIYVLGRGFVGGRRWHSVIYHPPVQSMAANGRVHPNEKPVGLLERLLSWCPGSTVLDPFMGSGSTGVACVKSGRAFVGVEIVERYFDTACRRIEEAYRQPRMFMDAPPAMAVQPLI
jgi:DNA modification methylase